ncbi:MAG: hypothetical protein IIC51_08755 [Planctomycetes bacterium]|nr:hypothetical protein [Planctomycetota bacterium]
MVRVNSLLVAMVMGTVVIVHLFGGEAVEPFMIVMPPLRERRKDLSKLVPYFIGKACKEFKRTIEKVEAELLHFFILYKFGI